MSTCSEATHEDAPVSLYLDSPYQISKIIGELYSNYYFQQHRLPVVGIDRDGIVVGGCGETGRGWPALVPSLAKHRADPDVDVVVQNEAH